MDSRDFLNLVNNDKSVLESFIQQLERSYLGDQTFLECLNYAFNSSEPHNPNFHLKIDTVLDFLYEELNTGHWSLVPMKFRYAYTVGTYLKTLIRLKSQNSYDPKETLKQIDMGLLLGAPLHFKSDLLTKCASFLMDHLNETTAYRTFRPLKGHKDKSTTGSTIKFDQIKGSLLETANCPSLETFIVKYYQPQRPVKLADCIKDWPALEKWPDPNYLRKLAGFRTVPIEVGSRYTDADWAQKLVSFNDFISDYLYSRNEGPIGYLAQHNLFDQIPEFKRDFRIPDYCYVGDETVIDVNAWLGPGNTVSPLHTDPKNNILTQVFGKKQVILFAPQDSDQLAPYESHLLANTSRLDPVNSDLPNVTGFKRVLEAGDAIFIPKLWWHHVTALEASFSVSFWW